MKKFLSIFLVFAMLLTALCFAGCSSKTKYVVLDDICYVLQYATHTARVCRFEENESGVYKIKGIVLWEGQPFVVTTIQNDWYYPSGYDYLGKEVRELYIPATVSLIDSDKFITRNLEKIEVSALSTHFKVIEGSLYNATGSRLILHVCGDGLFKTSKNLSSFTPNKQCVCHTIEVPEENKHFKSIDGVMYSKDGTTLVCVPLNRAKPYLVVPQEVTHIGENAFGFLSLVDFPVVHIYLGGKLKEVNDYSQFRYKNIFYTESTVYNEVLSYLKDHDYTMNYGYTEQQFLAEMKELYGEE